MFCKSFQYLLLLFILSLGKLQAQCNKEDFTYDNSTGCLPLSVNFKALNYNKGSHFSWDFGQGFSNYKKSDSTKINIYISKGLKSVSLKIKDSLGNVCTIDKYDIIDVGQATQIDIKISKSILCNFGDSAILTDSTSNVVKREWIIDGVKMINAPASIAVKFNKIGYKSIALKVTNTSGCIYTKIIDSAIQVFNTVNATFVAKATTFCPTYNDTFWNTTQSSGKIASIYWSFQGGNPSTSTDTIPIISYSDTGRFDVSMYIQFSNGCSYSQTKTKYITPFYIIKPELGISSNLLCNSDTLMITNNTSNGNVGGNYTVNTYLGTIVGGSIANNNLKVIYSNAGKHSLKISYNNINCYADTIYDSLVVVSKMISNFKSDSNIFCTLNNTVNFKDSSLSLPSGIVSYYWQVKSANIMIDSSYIQKPSFVFNNWGKYDISLTTMNTLGCMNKVVKSGYVIIDTPIAKIDILPRYGCVNDTVFFRDKTNKFSTKKPIYKWYILDEDTHTVLHTDTFSNTFYQFNKTGTFFAKLVITDDNLCIDSIVDSVGVIISSPNIDFMIYDDTVCAGEIVTLQQSTYPAFSKLRYHWEINHHDSTMSTIVLMGDSVTFTPIISGFYDIKCVGAGPFCSDTIIKTQCVAVNKLKMNAFVDTASVCIPVTVKGRAWSLENIHLSNVDTNLIFSWTSDPSTTTFSNDTGRFTDITFNQGGCYRVLVNTVNSNGCRAEVKDLFDACVGEIANFTIPKSTYCYNDSIQVSNLSSQNIGYKWYIKNKYPATFYPSDTSTNPIIICTDSGTYEIALIAYTSYGCPDTSTIEVSIKKPYTNFSSPDSISICGPTTVELKTQSIGGINFTWNFGDGSPDFTTTAKTTFHLYEIKNGKSKFDIKLNVVDASGCFYQVQKQKYIQLIGPSPFFSINKTKGCHETEITFADSNYGVARYFFNDGRGNFDTILNNKYIYKAVDTTKDYSAYYPFMIGYDSSGQCSNIFFLKDSIRIYAKPQTEFKADLLMTCENQPIIFSDNTLKTSRQYWSFLNPSAIDDTSKNSAFSYNKPGKYSVRLITENKYGCFDTLSKYNYISIQPRPKTEFITQDTLFCSFDTVIFSDRSIFKIPLKSFLWDFGDTLINSDTDVFRVSKYRYNQPGLYGIKLIITDSLGCIDSMYKPLLVHISDQKTADLVRMHYTTVVNDSQIEMSWSRNRSSFFEKYIVFRDSLGYISPVHQNLQRSDTSYIDKVDLNIVKRDFRYGVVAQEKCFKKNKPSRFHKYMYLEADTLSPKGLLLSWNRYQGWDSSWIPEIIKTNNLDSGFYAITNNKFRDSLYHDYPLCDSFYYYKIMARHKLSEFTSESNLIKKKPFYQKSTIGNEIITTTTDDNNVIIKWDTTNSSPFKHSYHIYKTENDLSKFKDIKTIVNNNIYTDEIVDIYKTFYIYSIVREDYCGSLIDPANYGNSIYLNARQSEDTAYLNWNSYRYWKKGVKNYLVQLYNITDQKYETLAKLGPQDTSWKQEKLPNLVDPDFCYRILAIGNDRAKNDTSLSNKACVVIPAKIFVPNAFSPNGDGMNDVFKPTTSFIFYNGDKPSLQYHLWIYDRWGEKLFETDNIFEGWDGNIKEKPAPADTYFYKIIAFPYDGYEKINLKGQFFLLR